MYNCTSTGRWSASSRDLTSYNKWQAVEICIRLSVHHTSERCHRREMPPPATEYALYQHPPPPAPHNDGIAGKCRYICTKQPNSMSWGRWMKYKHQILNQLLRSSRVAERTK
eukprot:scaffold293832_cov58-Attheya_sp.AAC.3